MKLPLKSLLRISLNAPICHREGFSPWRSHRRILHEIASPTARNDKMGRFWSLLIIYSLLTTHYSLLYADFFPDDPFTDKARGTTAASFLKLNPSARGTALADMLATATPDYAAGFKNPASYSSYSDKQSLSVTSALLPEEMIEASLAYGIPLGQGKMIVATHELIQPSLTLYDSLGTNTGSFSPLDVSIHLGYAASVENKIALGMSLAYLDSRIGPSINGWSLSGSFGVSFLPGVFTDQNLGLSLAFTNFGLPMKIINKKYPLPFRVQGELGYLFGRNAILGLDVFLPVDAAPYAGAALEYRIPFSPGDKDDEAGSGAAIRLGITNKNKTESVTNKLSFGLGFYLGSFALDLAMASFGNIGFYPQIGLSFSF